MKKMSIGLGVALLMFGGGGKAKALTDSVSEFTATFGRDYLGVADINNSGQTPGEGNTIPGST